jgi:tRNA threonylcarbamoyladenosine biosynthesis protein TsaE
LTIYLQSEIDTLKAGAKLAHMLVQPNKNSEIHLIGDLGAGKTTLARGFLESLGWKGAVKSPTYTLCEEYLLEETLVLHCDLYRLNALEDLEILDLDRATQLTKILLIEWPDRLPLQRKPDVEIHLSHQDKGRELELIVMNKNLEISAAEL